jgi:sugar phosphate permease
MSSNGNSTAVSQQKRSLWKKIFAEPPAKPVTKNKKQILKDYKFWSTSIIVVSYIIYVVAYFGRKNFNIAMPAMNKAIGITNPDKGLILGIGSIVYGIGKFLNGTLADRGNVRTALPVQLFFACTFNSLLAIAPWIYTNYTKDHNIMMLFMIVFWSLSQWFQSALFPYCAKSLIRWFPNSTRARHWAAWSTAHEIGSAGGFVLSAYLGNAFGANGYQAIFLFPVILSVIVGVIALFTLRDRPSSIGLPDVEEICGTKLEALTEKEKEEQEEEEKSSYFEILKKYVLKSKTMWNLALIYFCVYIFRNGPINWIFEIFSKEAVGGGARAESLENLNIDPKNAWFSSILCFVGAIGTFLSPVISEKLFKGRRAPANFWCLLIGAFSVIGMWLGASSLSPMNGPLKTIIAIISLGVAGFTVCVPQVLVGGICAVESSSKRVASAASGFAGLLGYFGAAFGDILNGHIKDWSEAQFGDARAVLAYWGIIAFLGALLCLPLWNQKPNKEYSH